MITDDLSRLFTATNTSFSFAFAQLWLRLTFLDFWTPCCGSDCSKWSFISPKNKQLNFYFFYWFVDWAAKTKRRRRTDWTSWTVGEKNHERAVMLSFSCRWICRVLGKQDDNDPHTIRVRSLFSAELIALPDKALPLVVNQSYVSCVWLAEDAGQTAGAVHF